MLLHWMARALSLFDPLCLLTSVEGFLCKGFICPEKNTIRIEEHLMFWKQKLYLLLKKDTLYVPSLCFIFNNKPFHTTLCPFEVIVGDGGNFVVVLCYLHIC